MTSLYEQLREAIAGYVDGKPMSNSRLAKLVADNSTEILAALVIQEQWKAWARELPLRS